MPLFTCGPVSVHNCDSQQIIPPESNEVQKSMTAKGLDYNSVSQLRTAYQVPPNSYRPRQKNSAGRLIQYEVIDKTLFKAKAHCACFITDEVRIHAWISAKATRLFNKKESKQGYDVNWTDVLVTESVQIEFILKENVIDSEEDFLYKVIVYFTTGKIMVQGKAYQTWCDEEFSETLDLVNKIMQNTTESSCEDNQILSGGETSDDCSLASEDLKGSIQLLDTEEDRTYVKGVYADREESEETENQSLINI